MRTAALVAVAALLVSCSGGHEAVPLTMTRGGTVTMDSTLSVDTAMATEIGVWHTRVQRVMGERLCTCTESLSAERPESGLTRLVADLLLEGMLFETERAEEPEPDFALVNIGGIRTSLNAGEVTLGDIYAIAPFDNEGLVVDLDSATVVAMLNHVAERGGEALSRGITMSMRHTSEGCVADNILVDGEPLDGKRLYRLATLDYVAEGGDQFTCLADRPRRFYGIILHDLLAQALHRMDISQRQLEAPTDARITVIGDKE